MVLAVSGLLVCALSAAAFLVLASEPEPDGSVVAGRGRWDVEKTALPDEEVELRTFGGGQHYGRFMMKANPGSRPSLQAPLVAVTLAGQAGRALAAGTPTATTR